MNDTRKAIFEVIGQDETITNLVSGVHYGVADEDATFPIIIFHKSSGNPRWTFKGQDGDTERFLIKAAAQNTDEVSGQELAELIAERLKEILTDAELNLTQNTLAYLRHERDVEYQEPRANGTIYYVGAYWRMETNK